MFILPQTFKTQDRGNKKQTWVNVMVVAILKRFTGLLNKSQSSHSLHQIRASRGWVNKVTDFEFQVGISGGLDLCISAVDILLVLMLL